VDKKNWPIEEKRKYKREWAAEYRLKHPEKAKEAKRKQYYKDHETSKKYQRETYDYKKHVQYVYGLLPEDFDALLAKQDGRCAICGDILTSPHVDHCHKSGRVRGLLCSYCNHAVGDVRERLDIVDSLRNYIDRME